MLTRIADLLLKNRRRIELIAAGEFVLVTTGYALTEHVSPLTAAWWSVLTLTTAGQPAQHVFGQLLGTLLALTSVFVIIPCITAGIVARHVGEGEHLFTHEEQEWCFQILREIHSHQRKDAA